MTITILIPFNLHKTYIGVACNAEREFTLIELELWEWQDIQIDYLKFLHIINILSNRAQPKLALGIPRGMTLHVYGDGPDWSKTLETAGDLNSKFVLQHLNFVVNLWYYHNY